MRSTYSTDTVQIDSWLTEDDERSLANDVLDGLTKPFKELPPKHFYDTRGSELFEQICELPEYYPTRTELAILRARAGEIVAAHRGRRAGRARVRRLGQGPGPARRHARRRTAAPLRPARRVGQRGRARRPRC